MKTYTYKEWREQGERIFGNDTTKWKFKCCNCGHEQSIDDFKDAGIEEPEHKVFFSCIGRWTNGPGTLGDKKSPCNYTLGGLFRLNVVKVIDEEGREHNVFDFGIPITEKTESAKCCIKELKSNNS